MVSTRVRTEYKTTENLHGPESTVFVRLLVLFPANGWDFTPPSTESWCSSRPWVAFLPEYGPSTKPRKIPPAPERTFAVLRWAQASKIGQQSYEYQRKWSICPSFSRKMVDFRISSRLRGLISYRRHGPGFRSISAISVYMRGVTQRAAGLAPQFFRYLGVPQHFSGSSASIFSPHGGIATLP